MQFNVQYTRKHSGECTRDECGRQAQPRVYVTHKQGNANRCAERKRSVCRQVGKVQYFIAYVYSQSHYSVNKTLFKYSDNNIRHSVLLSAAGVRL